MSKCQTVFKERCVSSAQAPGLYCPEHATEAARHVDAYNKAQREVNALAVLVEGFQSSDSDMSPQLHSVDEASAAVAVLKTYVDQLNWMIGVAENHQVQFAGSGGEHMRAVHSQPTAFFLHVAEEPPAIDSGSITDLKSKRDAALEHLAKAESLKSVLKEIESEVYVGTGNNFKNKLMQNTQKRPCRAATGPSRGEAMSSVPRGRRMYSLH